MDKNRGCVRRMQAFEESSGKDAEEESRGNVFAFAGMGLLLLLTHVFALLLAAPFETAGMKAFENPESVFNAVFFFALVLCFTAAILVVLKFGGMKFVHLFMLFAVAATIFWVLSALVPIILNIFHVASVPSLDIFPLIVALALTALLYFRPEWYVIDAVGLLVASGVASIFGISLQVLPVIVLLVILAVYDAVSVYGTKHMVSLASSVVEMRVPLLFVLPRRRKFSLLKVGAAKGRAGRAGRAERAEKAEKAGQEGGKEQQELGGEEAFFMGLGDAIIPAILAVSAYRYTSFASAIGSVAGTLAGYALLCTFAGRGKPHAGLPFLNSGAILGFLLGVALCS